jgi:hypothetical protein
MARANPWGHGQDVTQRSTHIHNLFVVRWGTPELADCVRIAHLIPELRARAGKPLDYIAVIPADLPTLEEPERRLLIELIEAVVPHCRRLTIVIESRGIRGAMLQVALSNLTRRHAALRTVDSLDAALALSAEHLPPRPMVRQVFHEVGCEFPKARVA